MTSTLGLEGTQTGAKLLGQTVTANPASVQTLNASAAKARARCLASVICVVFIGVILWCGVLDRESRSATILAPPPPAVNPTFVVRPIAYLRRASAHARLAGSE